MKNLTTLAIALFIIVIAFMPLIGAIETGFNSTDGYYGTHLLN